MRWIDQTRPVMKASLDAMWGHLPIEAGNRIIYFHSVHPTLSNSHRPEVFRSQLEWLLERGYEVVLMRDLMKALEAGSDRRVAAITFDDGYRDNLEVAVPVLLDLGLKASFFVVSGVVGDRPVLSSAGHKLYSARSMLTRNDLAEMTTLGFEIGSHTHSHRLATLEAARDVRRFSDQLRLSREVLSDAAGTEVTSFAYPNGQKGAFSPSTSQLVREAGFSLAATTLWGRVKAGVDPWALPRCEMAASDTVEEFEAKMTGSRDYRVIYQRLVDRSKAW